jgi:hypothetical protein
MIFAVKVKNNTCSIDWCNFLVTQCCGEGARKNGERKVEQSVGVGLGTGFDGHSQSGLSAWAFPWPVVVAVRRCFWVPNKEPFDHFAQILVE